METMAFDRDGFLTSPENWNEDMASRIAAQNGVGELGKEHWEIIHFLRKHYLEGGRAGCLPSALSAMFTTSTTIAFPTCSRT